MNKDLAYPVCAQEKRQIQEKMFREWQGKTDEQIADERRHHLATSDTPLARWWRGLNAAQTSDPEARASEDAAPYGKSVIDDEREAK